MTKEAILDVLKNEIGRVVQREADMIDDDEKLLEIGVSSIQAIKIINQVKKRLNVDINPVVIFEYNRIDRLAEYLVTLSAPAEVSGI
jgi:acyl carrier protein